MDGLMRRGLVAAFTVAAAVGLAGPAAAGAAKQTYAPGVKAQTLNGGAGGWTATDSQAGPLGETLCIVAGVLICPSATSTYQPDGGVSGAAGDGHVQTEFSVIAGVAGSGTSVWESKQFVYRGVKNKRPNKVTFKAKQRSALTELLALPNSSATYTAEIVPAGGGDAIAAGTGAIPASSDWASLEAASIPKGELTRGDAYSIRITSVYETGLVGLIEDGTVGYDNAKLVAQRGGKGGGTATKAFRKQARRGLGPAVERGKRLYVKVRCPKAAAPDDCSIKVSALIKKKGPRATNAKTVSASPGQKGFVKLKVRAKHRAKVASKDYMFAKAKFTAGPQRTTVIKRVRVRH